MWGDFLFRKIKQELLFIGDNIPLLGLGAFVCCFGGILVWVGSDSNWYYYKIMNNNSFHSLSSIFFTWLVIYGLTGVTLALSCLSVKCSICHSIKHGYLRIINAPFVGGFGYLMMLLWYVVTFCTRLSVFGTIILLMSIVAFGTLLVLLKRTFLVTFVTLILIEAVQIYFLIFTISLFLLN